MEWDEEIESIKENAALRKSGKLMGEIRTIVVDALPPGLIRRGFFVKVGNLRRGDEVNVH